MCESRFYSQNTRRASFDDFSALLGDMSPGTGKSVYISNVPNGWLIIEDLRLGHGILLQNLELHFSPVTNYVEAFRILCHLDFFPEDYPTLIFNGFAGRFPAHLDAESLAIAISLVEWSGTSMTLVAFWPNEVTSIQCEAQWSLWA
jgi:hypothetical protein